MSIENQLSGLLRRTGAVAIPGLGRFQLVYKSAQVDYIQKRISPPGKFIEFTEATDLSINDLSPDQSSPADQILWESFGESLQNRLDNKETIILPNVGSIYKDFRSETHFIPSELNQSDDFFGLKNISAEPISRVIERPVPVAASPSVPVTKPAFSSQFADMAFSVLIGLTLIAVSLGIWYAMSSKKIAQGPSKFQVAESTLEDQKTLEDILDYDAKWTQPGYYNDSTGVDNSDSLSSDETLAEEEDEVEPTGNAGKMVENAKANIPTLAKIAKKVYKVDPPIAESVYTCMISVGSFSSKLNAKSLSKKLTSDGYLSDITPAPNGMSRVVVMTKCSAEDKDRILQRVKTDYNPQAFVVK